MRGYIVKKKSRYYAVIYEGIDPATGKEVRRYHPAGTVRRDAERLLNALVRKVHDGEYVRPERLTLGEYLTELWLPGKATQLKPSTLASYRRAVETHIVPALGPIQLQQLAPEHLERFYAEKIAEGRRDGGGGLSSKTVRNLHVVIRKALADAMRKGRISRNVASLTDPPRTVRDAKPIELRYWTASELRQFLNANEDHRHWPAWFTAAFTGLRRGELLGLRWRDVDSEAQRLAVRQTLLSIEYKLSISDGKSENAERVVDLDDRTVAVLRAHRARQAEERLLVGAAYEDQDLVFAHPDGRPIHPDVFSQSFERRVASSGLPRIRFHDLRHTHATLMLAAGVPVKVVSERLGHAIPGFTQSVYQHVIPGMQSDAAAALSAQVFG
jgi:integrase